MRPNLKIYTHNHVPSLSKWDWQSEKSFSLWADLVFGYSGRRLSEPEDRLNAFQGIADEIEALSGMKMYYGMPVVAWPITLAWDARTAGKARSTRAPAWSWACLDTCVGVTSGFEDIKIPCTGALCRDS